MNKITPFLWFDNNAEEAMAFYESIFKKTERLGNNHLKINNQDFIFFDGGPMFKFNEAISFFVECKDQNEIDFYWEKLSAGGKIIQCGWLKDKFGMFWQIVPSALGKMLTDKDKKKSERVMAALMKMIKLDISELEKAYEGK